jgi:hypothetical protein
MYNCCSLGCARQAASRAAGPPVLDVRDLADKWLKDETTRFEAYEAGAKAAKQAWETANAHFLHAVNLGSAAMRRT